MSLSKIDIIIGREIGQLCWYLLPDIYPGINYDEDDEAFRDIWNLDESDELRAVREEDPFVDYPVLYLGLDVLSGLAPAPFLYPPISGESLRLSEYLAVLRRFLILQFTTTENRHVDIIWHAVRSLATNVSSEELLHFVDSLWRGRWIIGAADWSHMRRSVITSGSDEGIQKLQSDSGRLEAEALRLIKTERQLKDSACSMNEWLHEIYCLLPDVFTWGLTIAWANEELHSDELEKFDRILDEFQADIGTTISIPSMSAKGGRTLADIYAIEPLMKNLTVDEAVAEIRGIYRGRTIIPRVWYEKARDALRMLPSGFERVSPFDLVRRSGKVGAPLNQEDYSELNNVDLALAFGWVMTMNSKKDNWLTLGTLFDYWDTDADDKHASR